MLGCAEKHTSNILFVVIKYIYKKPPNALSRPKFNVMEITPYRCTLIKPRLSLTWKVFLLKKWFRQTLSLKFSSSPNR